MPSEELRAAWSSALRPAADPFRSALARTIEEVRTFLDARDTGESNLVSGAEASLGSFAAGRVDPERFAALLSQTLSLDESASKRIEAAFEALRDLNDRLDALLHVRVPVGGSLRDAVAGRLAEIGRAFGAAHIVSAVRADNYVESVHAGLLRGFPFARWSPTERELAPPLIVEVAGSDCRAASLAEFLDGSLKILLHVEGPAPVAPLARLIAPLTYVAQTHRIDDLAAFAGWEGAGVVALMPEEAARFRHDPAAGSDPTARLRIEQVPEDRLTAVGGTSAAQQREDLELLAAWAAVSPASTACASSDDPAGKLAAWLLQQADLN